MKTCCLPLSWFACAAVALWLLSNCCVSARTESDVKILVATTRRCVWTCSKHEQVNVQGYAAPIACIEQAITHQKSIAHLHWHLPHV